MFLAALEFFQLRSRNLVTGAGRDSSGRAASSSLAL